MVSGGAPPAPTLAEFEAAEAAHAGQIVLHDELGGLDIGFDTTVKEALSNKACVTRAQQGAVLMSCTIPNLLAASAAYMLPAVAHGAGQKAAIVSGLLDMPVMVNWRRVLETLSYPRPAAPAQHGAAVLSEAALTSLGTAIGASLSAQGKRVRDEQEKDAAEGRGSGVAGGPAARVTIQDFSTKFDALPKIATRALVQFFAGKPCAPGYDQIKVGDVSDANPAAPAPARGSKAVLTEVTPAAKLLIATP